LSIVVDLTL
jgi:hypothetical protein